jgi:hypothetical protein
MSCEVVWLAWLQLPYRAVVFNVLASNGALLEVSTSYPALPAPSASRILSPINRLPVQSTVVGYALSMTDFRCRTSSVFVYLTPKSSTTNVNEISLVLCNHNPEVCSEWKYPSLPKTLDNCLLASASDCFNPNSARRIST